MSQAVGDAFDSMEARAVKAEALAGKLMKKLEAAETRAAELERSAAGNAIVSTDRLRELERAEARIAELERERDEAKHDVAVYRSAEQSSTALHRQWHDRALAAEARNAELTTALEQARTACEVATVTLSTDRSEIGTASYATCEAAWEASEKALASDGKATLEALEAVREQYRINRNEYATRQQRDLAVEATDVAARKAGWVE